MTGICTHRSRNGYSVSAIPLLALALSACDEPETSPRDLVMALADHWQVAAATEVDAAPAAIVAASFDSADWTPSLVPSTVLAALVRDGEYPDPYFGRNLAEIPVERFAGPWWYRTQFTLAGPLPPQARLIFEGINYSADVWLNGQQIGSREDLFGAFRMFEIDVSDRLVEGVNTLAVEVYPPQPGDPTLGFVDWNPRPPDRNMGLWRPVRLRFDGGVAIDGVFVDSDIDLETLATADLTIHGTLRNHTDRPVATVVRAHIGDTISVERSYDLAPGETRQIKLAADDFPQLTIEQPRLWWPNNLGEPHLYPLAIEVSSAGRISDRQGIDFGIRRVEDYLTEDGYRGYAINGKKVLIRGGGWVDELMLADDDRRLEDQMRYVRHMNLNAIRLEGFWGSRQTLFDLADRYGILVLVGWSCQWEWEEYLEGPVDEFGGIDTPAEIDLISRSLRDQVLWLRHHPSVLVWVLGSDMLPRPELERRYLAELAEVDPTRPTLASCATADSEVSGPTGVKMNGPYDWVPPIYWFVDRQRGGAYGFNTETGPGPQPPPAPSIRRMLPEESWWPIDEMWDFHSGRNQFNTIDTYHAALDARYGEATGLDDFARKAQMANYEGMRAMFEAFAIRRPATTGIIQWMLNSAWPEMYWQLYDYYLVPNGAFYGARDAARPVNIALDRADGRIVAINDTTTALTGVTARVEVIDLESRVLSTTSETLDVAAESIAEVTTLAPVPPNHPTYFVDARLLAEDGRPLATSFYWLSTRPDVPDWPASVWYYTPTAEFADLTGLSELPPVALEVEHRFVSTAGGQKLEASLANPTDRLAFFVELEVVGADSGQLAAPILWSDNYVTLLPGERREIEAEIPAHALRGEPPVFRYSGINVEQR